MFKKIALGTAAALALSSFSGAALAKSPVPGKPGDMNIVEIAIDVNATLGEFDYLLGAVACLTDPDGNNPVVDLLTGEDKYTLFAPTDAAFEALQMALGIPVPSPELTCEVDNLFGPGTLLTVLAYHVTEGRHFSNSVFNKNNPKMLEMLTGDYVITNPDLTLTDGAGQQAAVVPPLVNINASNGVIHVVNTVLLPFAP
jgi:uncharacterized surface protein with fasciclin (FAS1) repeats